MRELMRTRTPGAIGALAVALALTMSAASAQTVYVDDDAGLGGDGASWDTPFKYLQDAIFLAPGGAEIRVAGGIYRPDQDEFSLQTPLDRDSYFPLRDNVTIRGGYCGLCGGDPDVRDPNQWPSILDGDLLGNDDPNDVGGANYADNSRHVVVGSGNYDTAVLDGCTIRGGYANDGSGYPTYNDSGGGLRVQGGGDPTITNCVFKENYALRGGGAGIRGNANVSLTGCTFERNRATEGGGVYFETSTAQIVNCWFERNEASQGGGLRVYTNSNPQIRGSTFYQNIASSTGAGALISNDSTPTFTDCDFMENSAQAIAITGGHPVFSSCRMESSQATYGAGFNIDGGDATLTGCDILGNTAVQQGGAMWIRAANVELINCTIDGNQAAQGGGLHIISGVLPTTVTATGCQISGNTALAVTDPKGGGSYISGKVEATFDRCLIAGNSAAMGAGAYVSYGGYAGYAPTFTNCLLVNNEATAEGGALGVDRDVKLTLTNCTLANNYAPVGRVLHCTSYNQCCPSDVTVTNCVLRNGGGEIFSDDDSAITVLYSNIIGGWGDPNDPNDPSVFNIDTDPLFVDDDGPDDDPDTWDDNDWRLQRGLSPCIDAGFNAADTDINDPNDNPLPNKDYDGWPRFQDDTQAPDCPQAGACGDPPIVDMGASEVWTDCNGNDIADVCEVTVGCNSYWPCDPNDCAITADCDIDGVPDECQIADDPSLDCDINGEIDDCEIIADPNLDCNGNGTLDECDIGDGVVFWPPEPLNSNAATDSGDDYFAQMARDATGIWLTVWASTDDLGGTIGTDYDVIYARSTDAGLTWEPPAPLLASADTDVADDDHPKVAFDGLDTWLAVWHSTNNLVGTIGNDHDILLVRSQDGGLTWTDPAPLNTHADTDAAWDGHVQVIFDATQTWYAVWESNADPNGAAAYDCDILFARSTDGGITWTDPVTVNTNAATDTGDDWRPQLACLGPGSLLAVWESDDDLAGTIGDDFDILFAHSTDNGDTWSSPTPLNTNADTDSGTDEFPQVVSDGAGTWLAVWQSEDTLAGTIGEDRDILLARSLDGGSSWSAPTPLNNNAFTDAGDDFVPEVSFDGMGTWLAAWDSRDSLNGTIGDDTDILRAYSTDGGLTWSEPEPLNSYAHVDSAHDFRPQIAPCGGEYWVALWESTENLGGTIGLDHDIVLARGCFISDCNGNYVPDDCDLADCDGSPWCEDCNGNYILDECDITSGHSWDGDADGTPDECQPCTALAWDALAYNPLADDGFGSAVAVNGEWMFIGIPFRDLIFYQPGAVSVARRVGTRWSLVDYIPGSAGMGESSAFGAAVAISGNVAVVGAPGLGDSGAIYVYRLQQGTGTWEQEAYLAPTFLAEDARFGASVDVDGDYIVAGAPWDETAGGPYAGSAVVYKYNSGTSEWGVDAHLLPPDPGQGDNAGQSVGISVSEYPHVVIGAPGENGAGDSISDTGAVYRWAKSSGVWTLDLTTYRLNDGAEGDGLGRAVVVRGGEFYASAPGHVNPSLTQGVVQVFGANPHRIEAPAGDAARFGRYLTVHDERLAVASPFAPEPDSRAYLYERRGAQWVQLASVGQELDAAWIPGPGLALTDDALFVGDAGNEAVFVYGSLGDCNTNDWMDMCEIASGAAIDCNRTGVPDQCETIAGGDFNADGEVDYYDFVSLESAMSGPDLPPDPNDPSCIDAYLAAFDVEPDTDLDLLDFVEFQRAITAIPEALTPGVWGHPSRWAGLAGFASSVPTWAASTSSAPRWAGSASPDPRWAGPASLDPVIGMAGSGGLSEDGGPVASADSAIRLAGLGGSGSAAVVAK